MVNSPKVNIEIDNAYLDGAKADLVKGEVKFTFSVSLSAAILDLRAKLEMLAGSERPLLLTIETRQPPLLELESMITGAGASNNGEGRRSDD